MRSCRQRYRAVHGAWWLKFRFRVSSAESSASPSAHAPLDRRSSCRTSSVASHSVFIESWNEEFQAHFIVGEHPPSVFIYDVARALIGNQVITAVRKTYEIGRASSEGIERPATWRSWLVLDESSVAHFEVTFDAVFYDEYEERIADLNLCSAR